MRKPVSLIACGQYAYDNAYSKSALNKIADLTDLIPGRFDGSLSQADPELLERMEILFTGWYSVEFTEGFLRRVPNLKAVFHAGGSIRRMVTSDTFWDRDIVICNAIEANSVPVAEFTLGQILLSLKRYWHCLKLTAEGGYKPYRWDLTFPGGYQSTIGLIGFGAISRRLTILLKSLDVQVIIYSLPDDEPAILKAGAKPVGLNHLFMNSDVVSLHLPLLKATTGMINGNHFSLMKQNATFINTARGGLLNLDQLVEVAEGRKDLTFLLDVMDPVPPEQGNPIYSMDNIFISPHLAGALGNECARMGGLMVEELERFLKGDPLQFEITRDIFSIQG
jgi:phosphoglycerate dehydrogenase-like enzyme